MRHRASLIEQPISPNCPVRALHSLTETHARALQRVLRGCSGQWSLERHESYDGNLLLVLLPEADDAAAPTLTINRDRTGLYLGVLRKEAYATHGSFGDIKGVIKAIRRLLSGEKPQEIPPVS